MIIEPYLPRVEFFLARSWKRLYDSWPCPTFSGSALTWNSFPLISAAYMDQDSSSSRGKASRGGLWKCNCNWRGVCVAANDRRMWTTSWALHRGYLRYESRVWWNRRRFGGGRLSWQPAVRAWSNTWYNPPYTDIYSPNSPISKVNLFTIFRSTQYHYY